MGWGEEFIGGMVGCRGRSGGGGGGGGEGGKGSGSPPTLCIQIASMLPPLLDLPLGGKRRMFPLDGYLLRFLPFLQLIALTKHLTENLKKAYYLIQKCAED